MAFRVIAMAFRRAMFLAAAVLMLAAVDAAGAEPKRVLLLYSFGRDFGPFSTFSGGFREELARRSSSPIDFYEASVETARFRDARDEAPLADYLRALFAEHGPDLMVAIGGPAAQFLQQSRSRLFSS